MTTEKTASGSTLDHHNGATCFHDILDLFVIKLRASHEADMQLLRNPLQQLSSGPATPPGSGPGTPRAHKQWTSPASVIEASMGHFQARPSEATRIVASGGDSPHCVKFDDVADTQSLMMESSGDLGDFSSERKKCNFSTRAVWKFQRASTAEKSLDQLVSRKTTETGEQSEGLKKGFSFRGVPVLDKAVHLENTSKCVSTPTAPWRVCWNVVGLIAVIYDLILIPLLLMELPDLQVLDIIGYTLHAFWNLDIVVNFSVAYYDSEGDLIVESAKIAKHYASSWLTLDLGLVGLDWALYAMDWFGDAEGGQDGLQAGRTLRIIRFLRILRLMRLLKLHAMLAPILDRFSYGVTVMYFNILKIIFGLFAVNHFMACFWFAVGASSEYGWVTIGRIRDYGFFRQYVAACHWCLTQFGVGGSSVFPNSDGEFCFAILCQVIALLLFSFAVSLTTDAMLRLQRMHHERSEQFSNYRKYCKDRRVSKDLFGRTLRFLEYAYDQRDKQTPASEIALLHLLSGPLRNELQLEIWVPDICVHGFFRLLCKTERSTMQVVCRDALAEVHFAQADNVFHTGQIAKHMYFVTDGMLTYMSNHLEFDDKVGKRRWVSEAAMWTEWLHLGILSVEVECRLLALDVEKFYDCVKGHPGAFLKVTQYAKRYVQELNKNTYDSLTDVDTEAFDSYLLLKDSDLAG